MAAGTIMGITAKLGLDTDDRQVDRETKSLKEKVTEAAEAEMSVDTATLKDQIIGSIEDSVDEAAWLPDVSDPTPGEMFDDEAFTRLEDQMGSLGQTVPGQLGRQTQPSPEVEGGVGAEALAGLKGAGGKFMKVGLAGAIGFGLLKGIQKLSQAAPRLGKVVSMFTEAMRLFFRPIGDSLGKVFEPFAKAALDMATNFNEIYREDGLMVGLAWLGQEIPRKLGKAFANALGDTVTGEGDVGDIALLGGGVLTAAWLKKRLPKVGLGVLFKKIVPKTLLKKLPSVGIAGILGGLSTRGLLKLLGNVWIGSILGGLVGGELGEKLGHAELGDLLGSLGGGALAGYLGHVGIGALLQKLGTGAVTLAKLLGTVGLGTIVGSVTSVASLIYGTIALHDLVDGDISDWNLPGKFGKALGEGFADMWPDMADDIHEAFTNNPVYDLGEDIREGYENFAEGDDEDVMDEGSLYGDAYDSSQSDSGHFTPDDFPRFPGTGVGLLQSGGVVTGPMNAIVGEGHESEAVQPLSHLESMLDREREAGARAAEGSATAGGGRTDDIVDRLDDLIDEIRHLDLQTVVEADGRTLADVSRSNDERYRSSRVVTR